MDQYFFSANQVQFQRRTIEDLCSNDPPARVTTTLLHLTEPQHQASIGISRCHPEHYFWDLLVYSRPVYPLLVFQLAMLFQGPLCRFCQLPGSCFHPYDQAALELQGSTHLLDSLYSPIQSDVPVLFALFQLLQWVVSQGAFFPSVALRSYEFGA